MNELHRSSSPYLQQHAHNPVHWKLWSPESLQLARAHNKLLLISIGYSACHWCHVMERESFEDHEVAQLMNAHFVNIKIDREIQPDVDAVYMKAVQLMTGQGGWPLNVVALPDGRPIWGGTYFRKAAWMEVLGKLASLQLSQGEVLAQYATELLQGLQVWSEAPQQPDDQVFEAETQLTQWVAQWQQAADLEYGGTQRAPKFMMPVQWPFLMQYAHKYQDSVLANWVKLSLDRMAMGGVFDVLEGGFCRYSVDARWHVPHFEKMLYDNGQLLAVYAEAYRWCPSDLYAEVLVKTTHFLTTACRHPQGGFYASWDADSPNAQGDSEEGAYYVWTEPELREVLGADFDAFAQMYNINDFGHWEHGNYVLIRTQSEAFWAAQWGVSEARARALRARTEQALLRRRAERPAPGLDRKIVCSWNAMAIYGLVEAWKTGLVPDALDHALQAARCIQTQLTDAEGHLLRSWLEQPDPIIGFAEDYAWVIRAWLALFEATADPYWADQAKSLMWQALDLFYDDASGFFQYQSHLAEALICPHYEWEDNVIPSANALMAWNLSYLSRCYELPHFQDKAQRLLEHVLGHIDQPSAYALWLQLALHQLHGGQNWVVSGPEASEVLEQAYKKYAPFWTIFGSNQPHAMAALTHRFQAEQTAVYVCRDHHCEAPTTDIHKALQVLQ